MQSIKSLIIQLAKDRFHHMCFPRKTNHPDHKAFRAPDDLEPFGFDYHGIAIEVHIEPKLKGESKVKVLEPTLLIIGIREDGLAKIIAEGVHVDAII